MMLSSNTEGEREAVIRFVRRFRVLPIRRIDQRTIEFLALISEALKTGEIDAQLMVSTSPRLRDAFDR